VLISFILWLPMRLTSEVLYTIPEGPLILLFIKITVLIILNAVPELIYQSRASGLELIAASYKFIIENWPEWFTPNLAIAVAGMILTRALGPRVSALPFYMEIFVMTSVLGLVLTYLMIFRGILFSELNGSNRRARVYRYKVTDKMFNRRTSTRFFAPRRQDRKEKKFLFLRTWRPLRLCGSPRGIPTRPRSSCSPKALFHRASHTQIQRKISNIFG
jgi:hypothetical protein